MAFEKACHGINSRKICNETARLAPDLIVILIRLESVVMVMLTRRCWYRKRKI